MIGTSHTRRPSGPLRLLLFVIIAGLIVAADIAHHLHPPKPHPATSTDTRRAAHAGRPARRARSAAPARLPTRLRAWAGVQLRPGLDR